MLVRCLHCHEPIEVPDEGDLSHVNCSACGGSFSLVGETTAPYAGGKIRRLAHFELIDQVGVGAFGSVWKARDTRLDRIVAVKVPRAGHLDSDEALHILNDSAQGATLDEWHTSRWLSPRAAAEQCLEIAAAWEHPYRRGVVDRELKPGNITMDLGNRLDLLDLAPG